MATPKPTILLVPGAWHTPAHYSTLLKLFESSSYPTTSSALPSVTSSTPLAVTVSTDIDFVRDTLVLPLLDAGKDVIVLSHSYGGFVGGAAAKGLSKSERAAEGKEGGVVGLIFVAAFLGKEGQDLLGAVGGTPDPRIDVDEAAGLMTLNDPIGIFYHDVEPSIAADAVSKILPHAYSSITTPLPAPAWAEKAFDGKRAYIKTSLDSCVPPFAQDLMCDHSGVEWDVRTMDTAHSPFLVQPENLRDMVLNIMDGFTK